MVTSAAIAEEDKASQPQVAANAPVLSMPLVPARQDTFTYVTGYSPSAPCATARRQSLAQNSRAAENLTAHGR
jgi:hypothetical protein